jgi:hypothetical protein
MAIDWNYCSIFFHVSIINIHVLYGVFLCQVYWVFWLLMLSRVHHFVYLQHFRQLEKITFKICMLIIDAWFFLKLILFFRVYFLYAILCFLSGHFLFHSNYFLILSSNFQVYVVICDLINYVWRTVFI